MELKQAIDVIEQALEMANVKGTFKLQESAIIATALTTLKQELSKPVDNEEIKELPKTKK